MNKFYRTKWNQSRGLYVVSNEISTARQKGGGCRELVKTILSASIALVPFLASASGSYELDPSGTTIINETTWTTDSGSCGFWGSETRSVVFEVSGNHLIKTNGQQVSVVASANKENESSRAAAIAVDTNTQLEMVGDFNLTAQAEGSAQARTVALDSGSYTFNGNFDIKAQSQDGYAAGVFIWTNADSVTDVTFEGSRTAISSIREGSTTSNQGSEGLQIGYSTQPGAARVNFNASETYIHSENYGYTTDALNLLGGDVVVNLNSNKTVIEAISDRWAQAVVINWAGDNLNINHGDVTIISKLVDPKVDGVQAMVATGISQYEGVLNVDSGVNSFVINVDNGGEGSVNPTEIQQSSIGFLMQGTANIASDIFSISVSNTRGSKEGAWTEGLTITPYIIDGGVGDDGRMTIADKTFTSIHVSSKSDTRGINNSGLLTVNGAVEVAATSTEGTAVAVNAEGSKDNQNKLGNGTAVFNGTTVIQAESETGSAIGIRVLDESKVELNGTTEISAKADDDSKATGIDLSGSGALAINGQVSVTAATALSLADNYSLTIGSANGSSSSLIVNGLVNVDDQASGLTNVTNAVYRINGAGSSIGDVNINSLGVLEFGSGNYVVGNITGDDTKTLKVNDLTSKISVDSVTNQMTYAASGSANDSVANAQEAANALTHVFEIAGNEIDAGSNIVVEEGLVNDTLTATVGDNGELENIVIKKNSKLDAMGSIAALSMLSWRHETNSLIKRMGELRDTPQGIGSWVRIYGSKQSYGAQNMEQTSSSIQLGSDYDIGANWKVGAAFSYTDSSANYAFGDADNDSYSLAVYGTWLGDNGDFVDLIAKYGRLSTEFNFDGMKGDYDNNALSLSVEYGHRFELSSLAFVEPQLELTYSRVNGEDFTTGNNVSISQDDFDSLIGRIGIRGGFFFPEKQGTIYARFSVLNDFMGKFDASASSGPAQNTIHDDIGGTWVEYGIGANYRLSDQTSGYLDLERTSGGDITEDWRWNIGIRHVW